MPKLNLLLVFSLFALFCLGFCKSSVNSENVTVNDILIISTPPPKPIPYFPCNLTGATADFMTADNETCFAIIKSSRSYQWHAAEDMCRRKGGHLASVESIEEQKFMVQLAEKIGFAGSLKMWIGLNSLADPSRMEWVDGSSVEFNYWWADILPDRLDRCVVADAVKHMGLKGMWVRKDCNDFQRFAACKAYIKPAPTPKPAPHNGHCAPGWREDFDGEYCYKLHFYFADLNFANAEKNCEKDGAQLVVIKNEKTQLVVQSLLEDMFYSRYQSVHNKDVWIGLSRKNTWNQWTWADQSRTTRNKYTNWAAGDLNTGNCVSMYLDSNAAGQWMPDDCNIKKNFICQKPTQSENKKRQKLFPNARCSNFPFYVKGFGKNCYTVMKNAETWTNAEYTCAGQGVIAGRSHLTSIGSPREWAFLKYLTRNLSESEFWIGLSATGKKQPLRYEWIDKWPAYFTNWAAGEPYPSPIMPFHHVIQDQASGNWSTVTSSNYKTSFVCKYRVGTVPEPNHDDYGSCPQTDGTFQWLDVDSSSKHCFWFEASIATNWMEAELECERRNGSLVSIHSDHELKLLAPLQAQIKQSLWIGLFQSSKRQFYWTDGSGWNYINWAPGQPLKDDNEHCVLMRMPDQKWIDAECDQPNGFICHVDKVKLGPEYGKPCPKPGFEDFLTIDGDACFMMTKSKSYNGNSWREAEAACVAKGAHLASIDSQNQTDYIVRLADVLFPKKPDNMFLDSMWIGMNNLETMAEYEWVDRSPVEFTNFYDSRPSDTKRCVSLVGKVEAQAERGHWNYVNCDSQLKFGLCKTYVNERPTLAPVNHTGNCESGWIQSPDNKTCYRYTFEQVTFDAANAACRAFSSSLNPAYLTSVTTPSEEALVTCILGDLKNTKAGINSWIGLKRPNYYTPFRWVDGTNEKVTRMYWAPNQPSKGIYNYCVEMTTSDSAAGLWATQQCSKKRNYLCKKRADKAQKTPRLLFQACPGHKNYIKFRSSCYKVADVPKTWDDAESDCQKDGGHLVSVLDRYEIAFLTVQTPKITAGHFWIGLVGKGSEPIEYGWLDQWPVYVTQWDVGEPFDYIGASVHHVVQSTDTGGWRVVSTPETESSYVCKISSEKPPFIHNRTDGYCPEVTIDFTKHKELLKTKWTNLDRRLPDCYLIAELETSIDRFKAEDLCLQLNGTLASLHSKHETKLLAGLQQQNKMKRDVWIGLHQNLIGELAWDDNSAVDFVYYYTEPLTNKERCFLMQVADQKWADNECRNQVGGFLCKVPKLYPSDTGKKDSKSKTGRTVGIAFGVLVAAVMVVGLGIFLRKNHPDLAMPRMPNFENPIHGWRNRNGHAEKLENQPADEIDNDFSSNSNHYESVRH